VPDARRLDGRGRDAVLEAFWALARREALPLEPLTQRFLRHQKTQVSRGWIANQRHHLKVFVARCPVKDAAGVRPGHVQTFLSTIAGPGTANRYRSTLSRFFEWAITADLLAANPVRRIRMRREERRLPAVLSRETMDRLMAACEGTALALPVAFGLYAGLRRGEICAIRWDDVDLDGGRLSIRTARTATGIAPTKARRQRSVPIHARLRTALERARAAGVTSEWVCLRRRKPWAVDALSRAVKRFGPPHGITGLDGLHVLRRTFASQLAISGEPLGTVAALLGDTISVTERYYVHLVPDRQGVLDAL
jgi:integrase